MTLATADELRIYLGADTIDTARADLMLEQAQNLCESIVTPLPETAKGVLLDVAARAFDNPTAATDRQVGGFVTRGPGGLWLTRSDKAALRRFGGGGGAFSIDTTPTGTSAVQTISGTVSGGTFRIQFAGADTAALAYNASTAAVQTALAALGTIGAGNVSVAGSPGAWVVSFVNSLATTPVPTFTLDTASLTGSLAVALTTPGVYGPGQNLAPWDLDLTWTPIGWRQC